MFIYVNTKHETPHQNRLCNLPDAHVQVLVEGFKFTDALAQLVVLDEDFGISGGFFRRKFPSAAQS